MSEIKKSASVAETMAPENPELCWYAVHTYSGYENKVADTLRRSVENSPEMQENIKQIYIPEEEVTEIRRGKRVTTTRKIMPGYVMIQMKWTTKSWYLVRNTRGVTGFVGPESKPVPLEPEDVERMLHPPVQEAVSRIAIGQEVRVKEGNLQNFVVRVADIDPAANIVSVVVSMFGREQQVDLPLEYVEPVEDM